MPLVIFKYNCILKLGYQKTLLHKRLLQPFTQDCDLASHTTFVLVVNFMYKWWDLQFKVDFEQQIFEILVTRSVFAREVTVVLWIKKPGFEPQARHQNEIHKLVLRQFPLSIFLAKTLRVNKKLPSESNLNYHLCIKLTHTT